jgi:8-oxo-dGTP pyrophosphatase MutT (NUDIX family)
MDISISLNGIRFNLRTAVLIKTKDGYVFEKDDRDRFYWVVGGRIMTNETSEKAAKREIKEELGIDIGKINLRAIVESFFVLDNESFHEICFYYEYKLAEKINLPKNYYTFSKEEMKTKNIQPIIIHDIIKSRNHDIMHIVVNK